MIKESKLFNILTRILIFILAIFMVTICLRFLTRQICIKQWNMDNLFTRIVMFDADGLLTTSVVDSSVADADGVIRVPINWEELYPFKNNENESTVITNKENIINRFVKKVTSSITSLETSIYTYTTDYIILHDIIVEKANAYNGLINWELIELDSYNNVITMSDGYLTTLSAKIDVTGNIESIKSFRDFLTKSHIPLLYVQTPMKVCEEDTSISGVIDFSNQNADDLLTGLDEEGISYLDLRLSLHEYDFDHHSLFFVTDHHWKPETGLWAAGVIGKTLNQSYGFNIETNLFNKEEYTCYVYENWFLGSQGKKVTLAKTSPDDISLLYPKFEVNLTLQIPSLSINKEGTFNIVYQYSNIIEKDYYNKSPYSTYFYGGEALTITHNNLLNDRKKVLILGDSFANSLTPFLALGIEDIDAIDLRHFNGSLETYINKNNYDVVIIVYNPSLFGDDTLYDFR